MDETKGNGTVYIEVAIVEGRQPAWMADLDKREKDEVSHAMVYADVYHHGTTGHMALMLIAKLARKLNVIEGYGDNDLRIISAGPVADVDAAAADEGTGELEPKEGDPDNRRYMPPLTEEVFGDDEG